MDKPVDTLEFVSQPAPASASAARPRGAQVLLGLLILGQIAFLAISNFLGMISYAHPKRHSHALQPLVEQLAPGVREGQDHFWKLLEGITTVTEFWANVTGQPQAWSLFAPEVGGECIFPALQLRWDEPMDSPAMVARPAQLLAATDPIQ